MKKKTVFVALLLAVAVLCFAGCNRSKPSDEDKSYLDENGEYYFGEWAFEMNGPEGTAALYDLSDAEFEKWLDKNGYIQAGVTVESARRDYTGSVMFIAKMSDDEIKATFFMSDEEIRIFRDYVADVFGDPDDYNLEDYEH